ncbi:MAG: HAD family hydrolase [Cellulosilyticaceae bacterium]
MKYDSIIFDLDGTLWDSIDSILHAWNRVATKHQGLMRDLTRSDIAGIMGLQVHQIGEKLFPHLDEQKQMEIIHECCDVQCDDLRQCGGRLYEGLEETLKQLAEHHKLFIVSNCQNGYIEAFYHYHGLGKYFTDFEHPGRTGLSKGENIASVIKKYDLKAPIYVGDTEGDLKGARFAQIPFVYASYGFGKVKDYDYKIEKVSDLIGLTSF